ncbi:Rrf2 family transcriptional regulator [Treponema pedis]|nr:Rrf2 family transcriptional regulator [Treponema pedis]QOW60949.1 Rrf2 family transcriptional regulator [Treponema pedis]QSI04212.1 transcriptional regulator [Treponema pedis]
MQIGTKFSVSIHILLCVEFFKNTHKVTSEFIASSVKTNPVVIRNLMGLLKKAGLISITAGTGGICLTRKASEINFLDVFNAVESVKDGKLFKIHKNKEQDCPVANKIDVLLENCFSEAQLSLEKKLKSYTLQNILNKLV